MFQFNGCHFHGCVECYPGELQDQVLYTDRDNPIPQKRTEVYPHAILYDWESWQDKSKRYKPTPGLLLDNEHVPISLSIEETLTNEVEHLVSKDPDGLVWLFVAVLRRRADVWARYCPHAPQYLPDGKHDRKSQAEFIAEWCNQVSVLGFNSGSYDLNLIKKYFVDRITERGTVRVAKKLTLYLFN